MEQLQKFMSELEVLEILRELNQHHIISEYEREHRTKEDKEKLISQISNFEKVLSGGLRDYIKRGKQLLLNSKNSVNPYHKFTPSVPQGVKINVGDEIFHKFESQGLAELQHIGFVLVAGGLGERLGYDGIKIGIPVDLVTKRLYIEVYVDYIKAYEAYVRKHLKVEDSWYIPLCIMTSDDTHSQTVDLFKSHNYFNLQEGQIEIVKQEQVPGILDNECTLSLHQDKLLIETKPHGHGDVHTLLYQSGIARKWGEKLNKKWILFFQDTNALVFNAVPSMLGVSAENNFVVNSLTIPRKPGEALGAICMLTDKELDKQITLNVEYNQLDCLLKEKYNNSGDVPNVEGFSDFPGNTNVLLFELNSYIENIERTKGITPEFVNPKYADKERNKFKSATRLETMMQDYPLLLEKNEKVGFTMYPRWFCFSTCKNKLDTAPDKLKLGIDPETAFSVEKAVYKFYETVLSDILKKLKIVEEEGKYTREFVDILNMKVEFGPKIIIHPSFGFTVKQIDEKIKGEITMTVDSTLILSGDDKDVVDSLFVDGFADFSLDNNSSFDTKIEKKKKHHFQALKEGEGEKHEVIRGYKLVEEN